jgi:hypothetical protein
MGNAACVACRHQIDAAAKICPYCGADPATGQKVDTQPLVQEVFQPRHLTATEGVLQFARQRQGVVVVSAAFAALLLLAVLHQFAVRRNQTQVSEAAGVPLTEVADLTSQASETRPLPMPELQFQYDGHAQTMRTFILEPGAIAPPQPAQPGAPATAQAQQQPPPKPTK